MSVFTPLEHHELEDFLAPYGLGRLVDFQGIAEGTENSNFFVSLEQGEFVLTLVERGAQDELPFFIQLLDVLHDAGLAVPFALRTREGQALRRLADKPALLQPRLPGRHVHAPNAQPCSSRNTGLAGSPSTAQSAAGNVQHGRGHASRVPAGTPRPVGVHANATPTSLM